MLGMRAALLTAAALSLAAAGVWRWSASRHTEESQS
jgi:hypothetical protein